MNMISKNEVKYIQSLYHKKTRTEEGVFIAEGPKLIEELLSGNYKIKKIYALAEWAQEHAGTIDITEISDDELKSVSNQPAPNNVLALFEKKSLPELQLKNKLCLMLDGIQDPGNLGTIIRIADWFGIDTIVASGDTAELYNPKVVQASMGSIARVHVHHCHLKDILALGMYTVYGALLNGKSVHEVGKIKDGIILIGNEAKGIRPNILKYIYHPITIPRIGCAESLNAAVAAGIILSHVA
jgi:RNA methyltransferase, TrmH family